MNLYFLILVATVATGLLTLCRQSFAVSEEVVKETIRPHTCSEFLKSYNDFLLEPDVTKLKEPGGLAKISDENMLRKGPLIEVFSSYMSLSMDLPENQQAARPFVARKIEELVHLCKSDTSFKISEFFKIIREDKVKRDEFLKFTGDMKIEPSEKSQAVAKEMQ